MTLIAILMSLSVMGQSIEREEELHPVIYPFTLDIKTANQKFNDVGTHAPLTEEYGFVIIPPSAYRQKDDQGGSLGMIVAHHPGDTYAACELRCARCLYYEDLIKKMTPMKSSRPGKVLCFFECKHCEAQIGSFVFTGNTCLDHCEYHGLRVINQEGYSVEPIENKYGEIVSLRITNPTPILLRLDRLYPKEDNRGFR